MKNILEREARECIGIEVENNTGFRGEIINYNSENKKFLIKFLDGSEGWFLKQKIVQGCFKKPILKIDGEKWVKIIDSTYMCSNLGRIKNVDDKEVIGSINKLGYREIGLPKITKFKFFHQAIFYSFNPDKYDKTNKSLVVDHIDLDKSNNILENLRLFTISENRINVRNRHIYIAKHDNGGNTYYCDNMSKFYKFVNAPEWCKSAGYKKRILGYTIEKMTIDDFITSYPEKEEYINENFSFCDILA